MNEQYETLDTGEHVFVVELVRGGYAIGHLRWKWDGGAVVMGSNGSEALCVASRHKFPHLALTEGDRLAVYTQPGSDSIDFHFVVCARRMGGSYDVI